jgi:hypothetical protein
MAYTKRIDVIQFESDGFVCYRWFDPDGILLVDGPEQAAAQIEAYIAKYEAKLWETSLASFIASIPPFGEGDLARKKHAVLTLLVEHEEDIKNGMPISADLVQTVIDGVEPLCSLKEPPEDER